MYHTLEIIDDFSPLDQDVKKIEPTITVLKLPAPLTIEFGG